MSALSMNELLLTVSLENKKEQLHGVISTLYPYRSQTIELTAIITYFNSSQIQS